MHRLHKNGRCVNTKKRMWMEMVIAQFDVRHQKFPGITRTHYSYLNQVSCLWAEIQTLDLPNGALTSELLMLFQEIRCEYNTTGGWPTFII
jgi:hypothetical protein